YSGGTENSWEKGVEGTMFGFLTGAVGDKLRGWLKVAPPGLRLMALDRIANAAKRGTAEAVATQIAGIPLGIDPSLEGAVVFGAFGAAGGRTPFSTNKAGARGAFEPARPRAGREATAEGALRSGQDPVEAVLALRQGREQFDQPKAPGEAGPVLALPQREREAIPETGVEIPAVERAAIPEAPKKVPEGEVRPQPEAGRTIPEIERATPEGERAIPEGERAPVPEITREPIPEVTKEIEPPAAPREAATAPQQPATVPVERPSLAAAEAELKAAREAQALDPGNPALETRRRAAFHAWLGAVRGRDAPTAAQLRESEAPPAPLPREEVIPSGEATGEPAPSLSVRRTGKGFEVSDGTVFAGPGSKARSEKYVATKALVGRQYRSYGTGDPTTILDARLTESGQPVFKVQPA
ncbi:MAG: hypothetical protein AAB368_08630, partial [bacterium]